MPFDYLDWHAEAEPGARLDALAEAERARGFDLREAPLLRMTVVRTGEQCFELIYTNHHILMDGWSNSQLMGKCCSVMPARRRPRPGVIATTSTGCSARIRRSAKRSGASAWPSWRRPRLAQGLQAEPGSGYASHVRLVDAERTQRLEAFARQQKVTVNTLLQAAWLLLLQR